LGGNGREVIEFADPAGESRVELNFLSGFAASGVPEGFARVLSSAWEAHFAAVGSHLLGPASEHNSRFGVAVEGYEDG
jgi:hypothetical protein